MSSPHARSGPIIFVLALAGITGSFMQTIVVPIQAELPALLHASRDQTAWVVTVTLLVAAICTPITGRLGDLYGKRRVALVLIALLVAGSVISALSFSVAPLIVGRGLQGAGMGVIPLGIGILRDAVSSDRLPGATALVSSTLGVGGALGLPLSALVTEHSDWHFLFWGAAALGVVAFVLVASVVPASRSYRTARFDAVGAVGLSAGLVCLLLAISQGNTWGWTSTSILLLFGGALVLLNAWSCYEWRAPAPLVDLRSSVRAPVLLTNVASVAMGFALFSNSVVFPQLMQLPTQAGGMGLGLVRSSLMLIPSGVVMLAMSPVAGHLEKRIGAKALLAIGALVVSAAYLLAFSLHLQPWHILIINPMIGLGIGLGYAAMPTLIMSSVSPSQTGAAVGLNTLMRSLGTSIASALIAGLLTSYTVRTGPASYPSSQGFDVALILGLAAGLTCVVVTLFIPRTGGAQNVPRSKQAAEATASGAADTDTDTNLTSWSGTSLAVETVGTDLEPAASVRPSSLAATERRSQ